MGICCDSGRSRLRGGYCYGGISVVEGDVYYGD